MVKITQFMMFSRVLSVEALFARFPGATQHKYQEYQQNIRNMFNNVCQSTKHIPDIKCLVYVCSEG